MSLFNPREGYKGEYSNDLIEQWSKCVEMANASSDKRISSNNVYITINAALIAVLQFTSGWHDAIISVVGIVISCLWLATISSYRELNAAKYKVINQIERELPSKPFCEEWRLLGKKKKHKTLTAIEKCLPWVFIALFLSMLILSFCPGNTTAAQDVCTCRGA